MLWRGLCLARWDFHALKILLARRNFTLCAFVVWFCRFVAVDAALRVCPWVVLGGPCDMVALSGLTLLVIVCQCGMLTLVLVCLGVRAECNWAKSSQQAASLRFCVGCWRTPFAFVRCCGSCACAPWVCHLGRVMLLCAPNGGLTDGVSWSGVRPAHHVDGLPLPNR